MRTLTDADIERLTNLIGDILTAHDEMLVAHREAMDTAKAALRLAAQMAAERDEAIQVANDLTATTRLYSDLLMLPTTGRKPS